MSGRYPYEVRLRPGCYSGPDAPLVSRHRTLRAAVRQARRSDRWQVEPADCCHCLYAIDRDNVSTPYGYGLYGYGTHAIPDGLTLAQAVELARRAETEVE